jgi:hypothetical protein
MWRGMKSPPIAKMVYAEVELRKEVNWRTIKIQSKSFMIAPTKWFIPSSRKFLYGDLGKKMPKEEINDTRVVWSKTLSDDEHTNCDVLLRRQIEATIKEKMLENILNDMVDNENVEVPYLLPPYKRMEFGYEGEGSRPTMDESMPSTKAPMDQFQQILELKAELATSRVLIKGLDC